MIDQNAQKGDACFKFNKPRIDGLDMSFSGLKTSILYFLRDQLKKEPDFIADRLEDICASVQSCIVEILIEKTEKAIQQYSPSDIALAGGVAANSELRNAFENLGMKHGLNSHTKDGKLLQAWKPQSE